MSEELRLTLLGNPEVWLDGKRLTEFRSNKARALLFYLAATGRAHERLALAGLLWGDSPDRQARLSLSQALTNLRTLIGDYLATGHQTVALARRPGLWLDTEAFEQATSHLDEQATLARLPQALEHYRGDFLEGFYIHEAPEFEQWVLNERTRYRELALQAMTTLAAYHARGGEDEQAIAWLHRALAHEPWREEIHRQLMRLLAQNGQRASALAQFEHCRQTLRKELEVEPSHETITLYEQIKNTEYEAGHRVHSEPSGSPYMPHSILHNLPPQSTPFVGRELEVADVVQRLKQPGCRLLSLVGPGGIGKSRLAIQAVQTLLAAEEAGEPVAAIFPDGVYFVQLAAVSSASGVAPAIAKAVGFTFYQNFPPKQQVIDFLREKALLLVLDNLEHLLEGVGLIDELLAAAPGVKILATSQAAINLHEEWFYHVDKLPYPELQADGIDNGGDTGDLERYDAVRLFVQCAQQALGKFSLAAEQACIIHICRLVEGSPLAIELAAAWLKVMPCAKIAHAIAHNLDFLAARWHNTPERHHSMRAVFEYSLRLLSPEERTVLLRLAVFGGGFQLEAAEAVAGASLAIITLLVEKSLLYTTSNGRYQMHELLRQFAAEVLQANQAERSRTQQAHSRYYLALLHRQAQAWQGQQLRTTLAEIGEEIANIQIAWRWALGDGDLKEIAQSVDSLYQFYDIRSRYSEGEEIFGVAAQYLQQAPATGRAETLTVTCDLDLADSGSASPEAVTSTPKPARPLSAEALLCKFLAYQGAFGLPLGQHEKATHLLQQSLALAQRHNLQSETAFCYNLVGIIAAWQGEYDKAKEQWQQSLAIYRAAGDLVNTADTLVKLAEFAAFYSEYQEAKPLAYEGLALSRQLERHDWVAHALDKLGISAFYLGEYDEARRCYEESLAIFQQLGNQVGVALALGGVGWVAWARGSVHYAEAIVALQQSLAICRQCGHRLHIATRLYLLGVAYNSAGDYERGFQACQEGLFLAKALKLPLFVTLALHGMGDAACGLGDFEASRAYLNEALETNCGQQAVSRPAETLIYYATLLDKESAATDAPTSLAKRTLALALLSFVLQQRVGWHILLQRARHLHTQLAADLPPKVVAAAQQWALQHSLDEIVAALLSPADEIVGCE